MKLSFFLPHEWRLNPGEHDSWVARKMNFPVGNKGTALQTIYLTWFLLRESGVECELVAELPKEGVLFIDNDHLSTLGDQLVASSDKLFVISFLNGSFPSLWAHFYLVDHPLHGSSFKDACYIPPWPHPYLQERDAQRGDRFENLCVYGDLYKIHPYLHSNHFRRDLFHAFGIKLIYHHCASMYDFHEVDVILGMHHFSEIPDEDRSSRQLYHAWLAKIPFIAGNRSSNSSFATEGKPQHDYLVATTGEELLEQLYFLKNNSQLRSELVAAGSKKVASFSQDAILRRWHAFLKDQLPTLLDQWSSSTHASKVLFWNQKHQQYQQDIFSQPQFYHKGFFSLQLQVPGIKLQQGNALKKEITEVQKKIAMLREQKNQQLLQRWEMVLGLLEKLVELHNILPLYQEISYVPEPFSQSYYDEGEALIQYYLDQSKFESEAALSGQGFNFMGWVRSLKEVQSYYQLSIDHLYKSCCQIYEVQDAAIELEIEDCWHLYQKIEAMQASPLHQYAQKSLDIAKRLEFLWRQPQGENSLSAQAAHDKRLSLYWSYRSLQWSNQLLHDLNKGREIGLPYWNRLIKAAQSASEYRDYAFNLREQGKIYYANFLSHAAHWEANTAMIGVLEREGFLFCASHLPLYRRFRAAFREAHRASLFLRYLGLPIALMGGGVEKLTSSRWHHKIEQLLFSVISKIENKARLKRKDLLETLEQIAFSRKRVALSQHPLSWRKSVDNLLDHGVQAAKEVAQQCLPPFISKAATWLKKKFFVSSAKPQEASDSSLPQKTIYYGLQYLDMLLEKKMNYNDGFFVELGAHNGIYQSNTLYFEQNKNWRGILIEPILHQYLNCRKVRSPETQIFCAACVSFDYHEPFVPVIYSGVWSSSIGLESDVIPNLHAKQGECFLPESEHNVTVGAPARTLTDILMEAKAPKVIDFLSLDVEGAEKEVLKGVDWHLFQFKYICTECRDIEKMRAYLEPRGYQLKEKLSHHDYFFEFVGEN